MLNVSRNWGIITPKTQQQIGKTKILVVGCGLGSQIAILAARTGFRNFTIIDGDKVKSSNLNRQAFNKKDIGKNKAMVLHDKIMEISPDCQITVHDAFLKERRNVAKWVHNVDFIVNMADPDEAMWTLSEVARAEGKVEFHPLNIGWMGYSLVITPTTPSLEEIIGEKLNGIEFYPRLLEATLSEIPKDISQLIAKHDDKILTEELAIFQLGTTTHLTASLVVGTMVKIIGGETVSLAPKPILANPWSNI